MKLNLRSVDLNLLTIFDAIMGEKQMTRAAKRLHMTQPAASHALTRLRHTFNDELFIRTRKGMKPTPRAEELAGPVREVLSLIQETLDPEPTFDPTTSSREFRIAFFFGRFGEFSLLPTLLHKVNERETLINIKSYGDERGDVISLLKDGELDFSFDFQLPEEPALDSSPCGNLEMVVVARKNHPRLSESVSPQDYFAERHIVASVSEGRREIYEELMREQGGERTLMAEVNQVAAIPMLVMHTDGIATVPRVIAEMFLHEHQLEIFPFPLDIPPRPIYLIWHQAMNRDKGHQWLKELILAC